nr:hypothetical protein [Tanacetum cinerariifolium]
MNKVQEEVQNVVGKKKCEINEDEIPKLIYLKALGNSKSDHKENPEEFLLERFLGSDIDFRGNDFEFIPFRAGQRICPGISLGVVTAELLLANLVYLFDWGLPVGMMK